VQDIVEDAERLREKAAVAGSGGAFEGTQRSNGEDGSEENEQRDDNEGDEEAGATVEDERGEPDENAEDPQSGLADFM
jgi:replication factor C large subunit